MQIVLTDKAKEDLFLFKKAGDKKILKKIDSLVTEIAQTPFTGSGKPESLKYGNSGLWSRRISQEHRLVYKVEEDKITIFRFKNHYV